MVTKRAELERKIQERGHGGEKIPVIRDAHHSDGRQNHARIAVAANEAPDEQNGQSGLHSQRRKEVGNQKRERRQIPQSGQIGTEIPEKDRNLKRHQPARGTQMEDQADELDESHVGHAEP